MTLLVWRNMAGHVSILCVLHAHNILYAQCFFFILVYIDTEFYTDLNVTSFFSLGDRSCFFRGFLFLSSLLYQNFSLSKISLCSIELNNYFFLSTPFQTSPGVYVSAVQVFWNHCGKRRNLLITSNFSFSHSVFY